MPEMKVALVTGASSGIGAASSLALLSRGWTVYAGARRVPQLLPLTDSGAHPLRLDVTDAASRRSAVDEVLDRHGRVDLLVNNAGIGPLGPLEESTEEMWQRVFDTNVFAPAQLARLVLPAMRERGSGRIVNIGSAGGEFVTPMGGVYHASKYALEAITDALRAEARPFGIHAVLVQPGPVRTPLAETAIDITLSAGSPYGPAVNHLVATTRRAMGSGRGFLSADAVATVVVRASTARRPRDRYKVGPVAHALPALRRWLPVGVWDALVARQTGLHLVGRPSVSAAGVDDVGSGEV